MDVLEFVICITYKYLRMTLFPINVWYLHKDYNKIPILNYGIKKNPFNIVRNIVYE